MSDLPRALAELTHAFGSPTATHRSSRSVTCAFDRGPGKGDGIVLVRSASPEPGQRLIPQVEAAVHDPIRDRLVARMLVASVGLSGDAPYPTRHDLQLAQQFADQGWLRWVGWAGLDRIACQDQVRNAHLQAMRQAGVRLLSSDLGRAIDLDNKEDRLLLSVVELAQQRLSAVT